MSGVPTQISFRGVEATYHDEERTLMRELVEGGAGADELLTVHQIIAEFDATLVEEGSEVPASFAAEPTSKPPPSSTSVVNMADGALSEREAPVDLSARGSAGVGSESGAVIAEPSRSESVPTGHGNFSIPGRVVEQMRKNGGVTR